MVYYGRAIIVKGHYCLGRPDIKTALVETACMYFNVASTFNDFLKLLPKLSCENISIVFNFDQAAQKIHQSFGGNFKP